MLFDVMLMLALKLTLYKRHHVRLHDARVCSTQHAARSHFPLRRATGGRLLRGLEAGCYRWCCWSEYLAADVSSASVTGRAGRIAAAACVAACALLAPVLPLPPPLLPLPLPPASRGCACRACACAASVAAIGVTLVGGGG